MQHKTELYATTIVMTLLIASIILSAFPVASGAGAITVTPTTQAKGGSVTVAGTGFAASTRIAIVIGTEITVTNESHPIANTAGTGPFTAYTNHSPIKPGSFYYHCVVSSDTNVVESDYYDNGDGTLTSSSTYALNPFVDYVTGAFGRSTSSAWDTYTVVYTASYTYYQYTITPAAGVTSSAAGTFSASVTIPAALANGNYNMKAIDAKGNVGTTALDVIPEGLTVGIIVALSAAAVIISTRFIRKQPNPTLITKK